MSWRIELWDQPEYASGAQRLAMVDEWSAGGMKLSVDGTDLLNLTAAWDANWLATAQPRHVLRVTDELERVTEWRIIRILDGRGGDRAQTSIEAEGLLSELARPLVLRGQSGGAVSFSFNVYDSTPEQILEQFVEPRLTAEGLGHFELGTITPTDKLTLAWERYSALELISELANRTGYERWVERDEAGTRYLIHIGTRGLGEPTVRTAFNRGNLLTYERDQDSLTVSTVTISTGKKVDGAAEKSTIGFAAWEVTGSTGSTLTITDPSSSVNPIRFDDQLNGLYVLRPYDGGAGLISDSSATGQTVTVSTYAGPYLKGTTTGKSENTSSVTVTLPTGAVAGDLVAINLAAADSATETVTAPTGWSVAASGTYTATGRWVEQKMYYRVLTTGISSVAFTASATIGWLYQAALYRDPAATGLVADALGVGSSGTLTLTDLGSTGQATSHQAMIVRVRETDRDDISTLDLVAKGIPAGRTITYSENTGSTYYGTAVGVAWAGAYAGAQVGEHVQIVSDSAGTLAYELTNPTGVANYGRVVGTVDDEELRGERNWLTNGLFTTYGSGAVADGYALDPAPTYSARRRPLLSFTTMEAGTITSSVATGSVYRVQMSGLTPSRSIGYGDLLSWGTGGTVDYVVEGESVPVTTGGSYQFLVNGAVATGPAIIAAAPTNGSVYSNAIGFRDLRDLTTDPVRVKYHPGAAKLWGSAGVTIWATGGALTTTTGTVSQLFLRTETLNGTADVDSTSLTGIALSAATFATGATLPAEDVTLRTVYTLTEDVDAYLDYQPSTIGLIHQVRWMQLHLGPDSQVPPVYGSHSNAIWHRANQHLGRFGTPPTTYRMQLLDLVRGQEAGLAVADDGIALGGTVRLVDDQLGQVDLRIVELRLDAVNPYNSEVTLATIPPRLAKIAQRARFARPTRPDPTPSVEKTAAEQPTAPLPTVLAPEIGVTEPAEIKLVGATWSIYS